MPRFLVEVPHAATKEACDQAIKSFLETGSHFFTNADWGCEDGEHKAWFILEIEDRESVMQILPPDARRSAKIVGLRKFTGKDLPELQMKHGD